MKPSRLGHSALPARKGPLATLLTLVAGGLLLALGFTFSLLILAGVAIIGGLGFGYVWWKTRALRKQLREQRDAGIDRGPSMTTASTAPSQGEIIEGEILREEREISG